MRYTPRAPDFVWGDAKQERRIDEALMTAEMPAALIRAERPPLPQIITFPPRFGYQSYQQRQIGIADIIQVPRIFADPRATLTGNQRVQPPQYTSWAQSQGAYSGSSRPSMGDGF